MDDVSASDGKPHELNHILTRLKPFTQYAFYVKTYTIATEKSGAQSPIQYFRTDPGSKCLFAFIYGTYILFVLLTCSYYLLFFRK